MLLSKIAELVGGTVNGGDIEISACASLESATAGDISFIESPKHCPLAKESNASAYIVGRGITVDSPSIETDIPIIAFSDVIGILHPESSITKEPEYEIGKNSVIHPSAFIGDVCKIGNDCVIHPNVTILVGTVIGDSVIIHSGTVIGSDGFKYCKDKAGHNIKIRHIGRVRIGNDVEIGANCSIDRGFLDETVIEDDVKLDNLVHIAHNVRIGESSLIAGQFGVAGSTTIGKQVMTGGQVGIADHVTIPDGTVIAAKSGVTGSIKEAGIYAGSPALPIRRWRKIVASTAKLPDVIKRLRQLEKKDEGK